MEGNSYLDELTGKPKEKESIWALLWGIPKVLRQNYGQVVVNYGEPIALADVLAAQAPDWDGKPVPDDEKPAWPSSPVVNLAPPIHDHHKRRADVNQLNLPGVAPLARPNHAAGPGATHTP